MKQAATVVALIGALLAPSAAAAQDATSAAVAGVVRDSSGAVLPGVTVEASSPGLIEKVRAVVADANGRYRIVDLRPGQYAVTFSLSGFRQVRREGIELTTGFVATVDADLQVGSVEETITVTGAAPVVDVQSVTQQQVFTGEAVRALPIGKNVGIYTAMIPGAMQASLANQDVGGTKGEQTQMFSVHGGRTNDSAQFRDGMFFGQHVGNAGNFNSSVNPAVIQEVNIQATGGLNAEAFTGGVQINVISRDGGNQFHGTVVADGSHKSLQGNNLSDGLRQRGASTPAEIRRLSDFAGGVGGPLQRDRLWFFASSRRWETSSFTPGIHYNRLQGTLFYEPDFSRPGYDRNLSQEVGVRLTYQPVAKHRFAGTYRTEKNCNCNFNVATGTVAPEAAGSGWSVPTRTLQGSWTHPATDRVLVQVGAIDLSGVIERRISLGAPPESATDIAEFDQLTNFWYGGVERALAFTQNMSRQEYTQRNATGSVSYVTGSHNFKVGGLFLNATRDLFIPMRNGLTYAFAGRTPVSVTYYATPLAERARTRQLSLFAQEQWTRNRLTTYLGVRYDDHNGYVPPTEMPAGPFVGARSFPEVRNVPDWKDISPRVGFSLDLFGTSRTALKASLGRYLVYESNGGIVSLSNPSQTIVTSATRTWNDANGDYVPQATELGPLSNANFGRVVGANTTFSDEVLRGWGSRPFNWQGSVAVQHQVAGGVGVNVGYFRTWYGNFLVTDNVLVGPSDFDSYCVTSPTDARLPGGSGERICGLLDVKQALFGRVQNVVNLSSQYGDQSEVFDGVDVTVNARLRGGAFVTGGLSTGRIKTDNCDIVRQVPEMVAATNAAGDRFCAISPPWSAMTQVKLSGSYTMPGDVRVGINYQNIAGLPTTAQFLVQGPQMAAGLGRPPSAGARATALVELIEPQSLYREKRLNQLNLLFARDFRRGTTRIQPRIELANALNANTVNTIVTRYGPLWQNVRGFLAPRLIKFGAQWDF